MSHVVYLTGSVGTPSVWTVDISYIGGIYFYIYTFMTSIPDGYKICTSYINSVV